MAYGDCKTLPDTSVRDALKESWERIQGLRTSISNLSAEAQVRERALWGLIGEVVDLDPRRSYILALPSFVVDVGPAIRGAWYRELHDEKTDRLRDELSQRKPDEAPADGGQ